MVDRKLSTDIDHNYPIKKLPFLSSSPYLFDVFFLIGYEQDEVNNDILKTIEDMLANPSKYPKTNEAKTSFFSCYKLKNFPVIINTVCNNNERLTMLPEEEIIGFTFPDQPPTYYYVVDPNEKETFEPNQYNVIFYLNNDTIDGKKKMTRSCFSFVFYEMKERKMQVRSEVNQGESGRTSILDSSQTKTVKIFIPKAICLISEYPFFTQFEKVSRKILSFFTKTEYSIQVPVEIIIYNLINFSPCPIHSHINLTFFPEQFQVPQENEAESVMTLQQLSGYPLLDFNFSEIFSILPIVTIAEIVICNILEIDMLFFSKNIEVLNEIMYLIAGLNYPCNDSNYHWFILSLSLDEFENRSDKSLYMAKPGSAMLGVNCSYNSSIKLRNFAYPVFVADLDNKEFMYKAERAQSGYTDDDDDDNEKTVKLIQYIHETILYKKETTKSFFEKSLITLITELETKAKKVIQQNSKNSTQIVPRFLEWKKGMNNNTNRMIQELFYDFNLNLFLLFYRFTHLDAKPSSSKKKKRLNDFSIEFNLKNLKLTFDEEALCDLISNSSKVNNFIRSFVLRSECQMETYQIPLMFSEEFIQIKNSCQAENMKILFFDVIDKFYGVTEKEENVNFNIFFKYYSTNLKEEFTNYVKESNNINIAFNNKAAFQYKCIELDKTVLYKYMYFINNLSQSKLEELFPSLLILKNNLKTETVPYHSVSQTIENYLITNNILTLTDIVCICFVLYYGIIIEQQKQMSIKEFGILGIFKNIRFCQRKYIGIILDLFLRMYAKTQSQWIMINLNELTGFILKENIIPNRIMMNLLEQYSIMKKKKDIIPTRSPQETPQSDLVTPSEDSQSKENFGRLSDGDKNFLTYNPNTANEIWNLKHLKRNGCRDGFIKEDTIMKYANNNKYDGDLKIICDKCNLGINPMYFIQFKKKTIESIIFSPMKILNMLLSLYNDKFVDNISSESFTKEDYSNLSKISLLLLFYLNNIKIDLDKEEKGAFEYLLLLFLQEYYDKSLP